MTRSVMSNRFATVPVANIPRSSFDRSSGLKTCFDADFLVPIYVDEVLPNDTFNMNCTALIRLNSPTLHPIMDNMKATIHWFFVAYRHVWTNWPKMHGAQDDPGDTIAYTTPVIGTSGTIVEGDVADYMGLPLDINFATTTDISALPFRAYRKIWNDWYRHEELQNSVSVLVDDGPDSNVDSGWADPCLKRGKRFDYFTAALPSLQKGTAVSIPIAGTANVTTVANVGESPGIYSTSLTDNRLLDADAATVDISATGAGAADTNIMYVDLTTATGPTLNGLRTAIATQQLLERDQRSGTRYREHLLAHFGADNDDLRLSRAEYLGGGDISINITPVTANTSIDSTNDPQSTDFHVGALSGYGVGTGGAGFTKTFKEWGIVIGLISVSGDITYSQGIDKFWQKSTRYDYAYPILANIGEQAVLDGEIWHDAAGTNNADVWGYQPRYEEYRFKNSRLTNLMNVDAVGSLSSWHLSEDFSSRPALDSTFIEGNLVTPLDRAITIPGEPQFNADFYFKLKCARPLPINGIPGLTRL